jgi:myo-inositol 2-dehydrogenase/D-chiro-inositol 1-dehydrogenase
MNQDNQSNNAPGRRDFLKESAAIVGGALISSAFPAKAAAWTLSTAPIKIALIGCGSRGAGAALNALSANANAELVAMADVFKDKLDDTHATLLKVGRIKNFVKVPDNQKFVGFDAYEKAIACADVVLLVTPHSDRPISKPL